MQRDPLKADDMPQELFDNRVSPAARKLGQDYGTTMILLHGQEAGVVRKTLLRQEQQIRESIEKIGYELDPIIYEGQTFYVPILPGYHVIKKEKCFIPEKRSVPLNGGAHWDRITRHSQEVSFKEWSEAWAFCFAFDAWLNKDCPQLSFLVAWSKPKQEEEPAPLPIQAIDAKQAQIYACRQLLEEQKITLDELVLIVTEAALA